MPSRMLQPPSRRRNGHRTAQGCSDIGSDDLDHEGRCVLERMVGETYAPGMLGRGRRRRWAFVAAALLLPPTAACTSGGGAAASSPRAATTPGRSATVRPSTTAGTPIATRSPSAHLVPWSGPIEHLFFHTLVIHPGLAFTDRTQGQEFRDYFVTVTEFRRILDQLYANGWTLVDLHKGGGRPGEGAGGAQALRAVRRRRQLLPLRARSRAG